MAADDLGPWRGLPLTATVELFRHAPMRWWISGGLALVLHLGHDWREHGDTDVGVVRGDAPALASVLVGWDLHVAAAGRLTPWRGEPFLAAAHHNNLWCRRGRDEPWALDITIGEGDAHHWISRRDPSLRVPWSDAVLTSGDGVPYLAPELQLLFKSTNVRPKDDVDAREVIPALDTVRRARLAALLPSDHPWQLLLDAPAR